MPAAAIPANENARLAALASCRVLDTPGEERFDELTELAATICETPIALISLVDKDRQWFKSRYGLDAEQTPREQAFCAYTILGNETLFITDAEFDPRTSDNPLVTGGPGIRFYAGVPLQLSTGEAIGTLCVIDTEPRFLIREQVEALEAIANRAVMHLELNRNQALIFQRLEATRKAIGRVQKKMGG